MAKLLEAKLETNKANRNAVAVTFYFEGAPTEQEVRKACEDNQGKLALSVDVHDQFFNFTQEQTKKANVFRCQAHPTG